MIEQNGSDPMFGKEKDVDDQDIIELTDEVAPESMPEDEDIIELTLEIDSAEDDEDIIELTSEATAGEDDDEEILELTSEVEEAAGETDDEEIIELTSEVEETAGEAVKAVEVEAPDRISDQLGEAEHDTISETAEDEEDLLNFLSEEPETTAASQPEAVVEEEISVTAPVDSFEFHEPADMDDQTELPRKDFELASVMGIELDPARDLSLEPQGDDIEVELNSLKRNESREMPHIIIPQEQLEAAIKRVIETRLSEKIDRLLTDAIEKAVTTEISRLKRLLTNDLPDD